MRLDRRHLLAGVMLAAAAAPGAVRAQANDLMLEAGVIHHQLTAGFPAWNHAFVRGSWRSGPSDVWLGEVVDAREFGDRGQLFVLGDTHSFDPRWYGSLAVAMSSHGFFYPHARVDATVNRKWGAQSNVVTTVGITAVNAKDGHADRSILLGLSYYAPGPWLAEAGMRLNRSNPGRVDSRSQYLALTYVQAQRRIVSLRQGWGDEAYQYIGSAALLVNFPSRTTTATWREWVLPHAGFQLRAEAYHNPYYDRRGLEVAVFREF
jgi:YaiO family outer membrane protein